MTDTSPPLRGWWWWIRDGRASRMHYFKSVLHGESNMLCTGGRVPEGLNTSNKRVPHVQMCRACLKKHDASD